MSAPSTDLAKDVVYPIQDEERCPKCSRDFATCRCYDNAPCHHGLDEHECGICNGATS